jgi:hypothetical protein
MSELNSTNIENLSNIHDNNVHMNITEQQQVQQQQQVGHELSLDQNTINQIVNGLQQASLSGATQLPSRDIPMNQTELTNDPQIKPNYIPDNNAKYIDDNLYVKNNVKNEQKNNFDDLFNEIQIPLLLFFLFFLFQLPFIKQTIFRYLSFLCLKDGNYNVNGYMFLSFTFSLLVYILLKFFQNR